MKHICIVFSSSFAPLLIDAVASADRAASFGEGYAELPGGEGDAGRKDPPPQPGR